MLAAAPSSRRPDHRGDVPPNEPAPVTLQLHYAAPLAPPIDASSRSRSNALMNDPG